MIVRKMTANFGVLQNRTLELSPGLNIIEAPNEYGKSTWCAFLRAMLYGVDSAQRSRAGKKPDKLLYAPWNGTPMSGTMELAHAGKSITLQRETRTPAAPMRVFSAVYTGTGQTVSGLTGENAGETLTGAALPVFERTAFIGPAGLGVQQNAELERKIAALVTAGEESGTFSEASARLRAQQRRCRYRNTGLLPEIEAEAADIRRRLAAMDETAAQIARLEEQTESARRYEESLRKSAESAQLRQRTAEDAALARCRESREAAEAESARLSARLADGKESLRRGLLEGGEPNAAAAERVRSDERRARAAERAASARQPGLWLWVTLVLLAGASAVGGLFRSELWLGAMAFLLAGAVLGVVSVFRQRESASEQSVLNDILRRYNAGTPDDIPAAFAEYSALWKQTAALEAALNASRERVRSLSEQELQAHRDASVRLAGNGAGDGKPAEAGEQERILREKIAHLRGRLDTLGDPLVLQSRLAQLDREHERVEFEMEAMTAALDELALADEEMQSEFSPALSRSAAAILSRLTGGAYSALALDRELNALVRGVGDPMLHESAFLSRGTADQLFLALRLALCEMILGGEDACPIVLDDALINFDDTRMGYALDYLEELSQRRQIILFSCHSREKRYIETKNGG